MRTLRTPPALLVPPLGKNTEADPSAILRNQTRRIEQRARKQGLR